MQSSAEPQEGPKIVYILHKDRNFWINLLQNKEMVFKNGFKNIQAMGYGNWTGFASFSVKKNGGGDSPPAP